MMNKYLFIVASIFSSCICKAQGDRLDTLYFDSSWNVVSNKIFADYYRIALYPGKETGNKVFRDFYMDGTVLAKGSFISLDYENDKNSIFDNTVERFYKNGNPLSVVHYANGVLDGEYIEYTEDGLIKVAKNYRNGKLNGTVTAFNPDGTYTQIIYNDDQYANPYYEYGSPSGSVIKLRLSDNSIFWESPSISEKKSIYKDGTLWEVYSKNGITIGQSLSVSKEYGTWYKVELIITNDSTEPVEFEPVKNITSFTLDKNYKPSILEVISSDQYIQKVNRAQSWEAFAVGLNEAFSTSRAGYSSSTTTTNASAYGYGNAYGSASAYSSGGYGNATFSGSSSFSAYGHSTTTTNSYNGAAAYQAKVISQERLARFDEAQWATRKALEQGYLKKTTINVGETISGYILISKGNGACLIYSINIGDAEYKNSWIINNDLRMVHDDNTNYWEVYATKQMDEIEQLIAQNKKMKAESKLEDLLVWFRSSRAYSEEISDRLHALVEACEFREQTKH